MLERMAIAVLLCIVGVLFISLKAALRRAREAEKHARSWKLAAERDSAQSSAGRVGYRMAGGTPPAAARRGRSIAHRSGAGADGGDTFRPAGNRPIRGCGTCGRRPRGCRATVLGAAYRVLESAANGCLGLLREK
jgi:hypothetical protein